MGRYFTNLSLQNAVGKPCISLFLTGCDKPVKCEDCHNWELHGKHDSDGDCKIILEEVSDMMVKLHELYGEYNLAILGGEPLAPYNINITHYVSSVIKQKFPSSNITVYTWRTVQDIQQESLVYALEYIDYGVLGAYERDLHVDHTIPSSTNQVMYDFRNECELKPIKLNERGTC